MEECAAASLDRAPAMTTEAPTEAEAQEPAAEVAVDAAAEGGDTADSPEKEAFYSFTWAGFARQDRGGPRGKPRGDGKQQPQRGRGGKPGGKGGKPGGKPRREDNKPKQYSARPQKKKDTIDPDNPFAAAMMGLKDKG